MIIRKKDISGKWYEYEQGVEFFIKPFKFSKLSMNFGKDENLVEELEESFMFCLKDWKGIIGDDGKTEFKCTDKNKQTIFDYYIDLREFVFDKIKELHGNLGKERKN